MAMNQAQREAHEAKLKRDAHYRVEEMVARHERRRRGEEEPLTAAEHQVRETYERARPVLDPATQALWDEWLDARCTAIINTKLAMMADIIGDESGHNERKLRDDVLNMRGSMVRQLNSDLVKKFGRDLNQMKDDVIAVVLAVVRADLDIVESNESNVIDLPNPIKRKA